LHGEPGATAALAWIQQDDAPAPSEAPLPVEAVSAPVKR